MSDPSHLDADPNMPLRPGTNVGGVDIGTAKDAGVQLLNHLRRSGIQFLPKATAEGIAGFESMFAESSAAGPIDESGALPDEGGQPAGVKLQEALSDASVVKERSPRSQPVQRSRLQPVDAVTVSADSYSQPSLALSERTESLKVLQENVAGCTRCESLASCRTQTVFGEGNPKARIVFLGKAQGRTRISPGVPSWVELGSCSRK